MNRCWDGLRRESHCRLNVQCSLFVRVALNQVIILIDLIACAPMPHRRHRHQGIQGKQLAKRFIRQG